MDWFFQLPAQVFVVSIIIVEVLIIAFVFFVLHKFGVKLTGNWPKVALKQGYKNAFFTGMIVLPIIGLVILLVIFGFGQSFEDSIYISSLVFGVIALLYYLYSLLNNLRKSGKVLLEIAVFPNRTFSFIGGASGLILMLSGIAMFLWMPSNNSWIFTMSAGLFNAIFNITMGLSRLQIREQGFWVYGTLLKWNQIESLDWTYDDSKVFVLKLVLKGKTPAFLRNGVITVPIRKKHQVSYLLGIYLPDLVVTENRTQHHVPSNSSPRSV